MTRKVLYLIVCAAGPASQVQELVVLAENAGWDVFVIPTPHAMSFLDVALLTQLTGHVIRGDYRSPGTVETFPPCDALIVVPATFNTVNKFALGIADTRAYDLM